MRATLLNLILIAAAGCSGRTVASPETARGTVQPGANVTTVGDRVIVATSCEGRVDLGTGPLEGSGVCVVALSPGGRALWSRLLGDDSPRVAVVSPIASDGGVVVAWRTWEHGDLRVTRLAADGSTLWTAEFATPGDSGSITALASADGQVMLSGALADSSHFVLRLRADGSRLWATTLPPLLGRS